MYVVYKVVSSAYQEPASLMFCPEDRGSMFLQNVGKHLPDYIYHIITQKNSLNLHGHENLKYQNTIVYSIFIFGTTEIQTRPQITYPSQSFPSFSSSLFNKWCDNSLQQTNITLFHILLQFIIIYLLYIILELRCSLANNLIKKHERYMKHSLS
jgi:hypothetical protein